MRCFEQRVRGARLELTSADAGDVQPKAGEVVVEVEGIAVSAAVLAAALAGDEAARLGGALVGSVISTSDTASEWNGRRVVAPTLLPCGECDFCRRAAPHGCAAATRLGTLAARVRVSGRWLAPADGDLRVEGPVASVLGGDGLVAYTAFCRAGVAPKEPVVVLGDGTRSRLVADIARVKGAAVVAVSSPTERETLASAPPAPWRVFALEVSTGHDWSAVHAALPIGSTLALADRAFPPPPGVDVVAADWGHPDLLPELVALAARRELDLDAVCAVCEADAGSLADAITEAARAHRAAVVVGL